MQNSSPNLLSDKGSDRARERSHDRVTRTPRTLPRRVLLVGWDAADWRVINPLLDAGKMPTLARLIGDGVMGNLSTLHPMISPMLWTSIATGKTADKHGISGFAEADSAVGFRPVSSVSRRAKTIWQIFQQALDWRCNVINWWASHPAEPINGHVVTDYFLRTRQTGNQKWSIPPQTIHPEHLAAEFAPLRMMPQEVTEELILPFIPRGGEIDQKTDNGISTLGGLLSECCSIQNAVTTAMELGPWNFTAVYWDSIDHVSHSFMPYHPPRQEHVPKEGFEFYKGVVEGIYRFHDMMLARLLELAGPESLVLVCSDHGFQSGDLRPLGSPNEPAGPTFWHREYGMFVLSGPGVRRDERIYGATLLDLVPTLLTLTGLPVGDDMDGKPLLGALQNPTPPERIPTWETLSGNFGGHPADFQWTAPAREAHEILQQLAALGYVDDPRAERETHTEAVSLETRYNLAQVHLSAGRPDAAIEIMETLVNARPWESRYLHQLANAYLKGGYLRAADDLLTTSYPSGTNVADVPVVVWILRARAKLRLGLKREAVACLQPAMDLMRRHPPLWVEVGWLWIELQQLEAAEACFHRALELDSECAPAFEGLSAVYLRRRENLPAIDMALEALQLLYHLPQAHFNLGVALARENRRGEAAVAFRRAIEMRPNMPHGHRWLAAVMEKESVDSFLAGAHRTEAAQQSQNRMLDLAAKKTRAKQARDLPSIPTPTEREERLNKLRPRQTPPGITSGKTFVIVSGLPRSGTSLMMSMLAAGGLPAWTDGERGADSDNPEGYFEWEAIKRVGKEPEILDHPGLERHALKVISALLSSLPREHRYRVLFMRRPSGEIAQSQIKMIANRGTQGSTDDLETLVRQLDNHCAETLQLLHSAGSTFEFLEVNYRGLVTDPIKWSERVAHFIGNELLPHPEKMAGAVRSELHRNRGGDA